MKSYGRVEVNLHSYPQHLMEGTG